MNKLSIQYEWSEEGIKEEKIISISFDFMKTNTISLPKIPILSAILYEAAVSKCFFKFMMWQKVTKVLFFYNEGFGKKGPNEVC